ncbi:MAG: mechanosensitive ion channel [Methylomicrobium sp.]|nr:mechanosensitive ion channel [Methylomicrobium sp.]
MIKNRLTPSSLLLFLITILFALDVSAIGTVLLDDTSALDEQTLELKIEALNANQDLDESTKARVIKHYRSIKDNRLNNRRFNELSDAYQKDLKEAPQKIKALSEEITRHQSQLNDPIKNDFYTIPQEELEQRLLIEKGKLSELEQQIKKIEGRLVTENNRSNLIRLETVKAKQDIEELTKRLASPASSGDSILESEAMKHYLNSSIASRTAEIKLLELEATSQPVRIELLNTELRLLDLKKNIQTPVVGAIEALIAERRQEKDREIQEALDQAEQEIADKHPVIQTITRENIQFSRDLQAINQKIEHYIELKTKIETKTSELDSDFKSAERKISLAGLSPALGKILREQRRNLPSGDRFFVRSDTIQEETALTSLNLFKVEDKLKLHTDINSVLNELMNQLVDPSLPGNERMMIQAELRVLLNNQTEILNRLTSAYTSYLRSLGDFDFARQQLFGQSEKFANFLDKRLLWVPSSNPIGFGFIAGLYQASIWLLSPQQWFGLIKDLGYSARDNLFFAILAMMSIVMLRMLKAWAKTELAATKEKIEKIYTDSFNHTIKALICTFILASQMPLLFFYAGLFLMLPANVSEFSNAIGTGLTAAAIPYLLVQFFYKLFRPQGIAHKHFLWREQTVKQVSKELRWVRYIAVPCFFLIAIGTPLPYSSISDHLGRLAHMIVMVSLALFAGRLLKPNNGLLTHLILENKNGWLARLRFFWYPGIVATPLIIAGFAVAGYYLSALELQHKMIVTLRLIMANLLIHELVVRWLTLANRQLALKNARQKRKTAAAQISKPAGGSSDDPIISIEEQLLDIPKINAQTKKLLSVFIGFSLIVGIWMIWRDILPAFSFMDNIVLWQHLQIIDNQETFQPVTLTNLLLAGLYVFLVIVAVKNFSGLMELMIFRQISAEAGTRYAVNQLAKYGLIAIGFIIIANELGGSWSQVQWLVAALSLGLGFGLQEIFANLVSGIIILFERPIRVGDTVTIGDISGKVSRIQMRATTLTDWDQKELIVPNKTFITGQMINWTLTDQITRVVIPVGIAYGSDIELAYKVMIETVKSTPRVLAEPEPNVLMVGFGPSSLDFSIRIFVSDLSGRLAATHDLHMRLNKAFKDHNIQIPFPQRDIHIKTAPTGALNSLAIEQNLPSPADASINSGSST